MSQAVQLGQAIASADDDRVLSIAKKIGTDAEVIQKTVEALPVNQIVPFLQLIEKFMKEDNGKNLQLWVIWLNTIFTVHSTYLSTISNLNEKVGLLTDWMHSRVQNLSKLLQLQGKLELITGQMHHTSNAKSIVNVEAAVTFDGC